MQRLSLSVCAFALVAAPLSAQMGHAPESPTVTSAAPSPSLGIEAGDSKSLMDAKRHYRVQVKHDAFTGITSTTLEIMRVEKGALFFGGTKNVDCSQMVGADVMLTHHASSSGAAAAALIFEYVGSDWMFIEKEQPLRLLAGDSVRTFDISGDTRRDVLGGDLGVMETAAYSVTDADLAWLASLPSVRVRVTGSDANCDFPLSPEALALAGLFRERVVLAHPAP